MSRASVRPSRRPRLLNLVDEYTRVADEQLLRTMIEVRRASS
jgi:hypothetical protein